MRDFHRNRVSGTLMCVTGLKRDHFINWNDDMLVSHRLQWADLRTYLQ